jgi:hypothetical protein
MGNKQNWAKLVVIDPKKMRKNKGVAILAAGY